MNDSKLLRAARRRISSLAASSNDGSKLVIRELLGHDLGATAAWTSVLKPFSLLFWLRALLHNNQQHDVTVKGRSSSFSLKPVGSRFDRLITSGGNVLHLVDPLVVR